MEPISLLPGGGPAADCGYRPAAGHTGRAPGPLWSHPGQDSLDFVASPADRPDGKLVLVTAMSPTPRGGQDHGGHRSGRCAQPYRGKRWYACASPAWGPVSAWKGRAAGGGYAVVPMEDINLHFTGDMHAIGAAHNLLAAMIDNYIHWSNETRLDLRRVNWRQVVDINDRQLRHIVTGIGGAANGFPMEGGFDITVASEVMAIFCLARDLREGFAGAPGQDRYRLHPRRRGRHRGEGALAP